VDLAAFQVRRDLVEQRGQHADEPGFGLAAQPQQNEVVPREYGVHHLRHHGVFISQNAGKKLVAALNLADEIVRGVRP
jgi:hypothetical protein